jgi:hypothetical protein
MSYDRCAEQVAEIARQYAYRRRHHIEHTGHTVRRLEAAVNQLLDRKRPVDPLAELRVLMAAVAPYARMPEHVEGLGPAYERARRAIAKLEGRCQARRFAHLPPP